MAKVLPMRMFLLLVAMSALGCGGDGADKALYASYSVTVSGMGKSDPDVMTVGPGASGKLLLTFTFGINTDAMGPNSTGLKASLDGSSLKLDSQPIRVDHSTGTIEGTVTGSGNLSTSGSVDLALHVAPTNFAIQGPDGGEPPPQGTTLDFQVQGSKE
jgi:hypothetical protein